LKVVTISVPSLRERREDIPELARHFLKKAIAELSTGVVSFQPGIEERLLFYSWPSNVRELENVILSATVRARGNVILGEDIDRILSPENRGEKGAEPASASLSHLERDHILNILNQVGWIRTKAAQVLGISLPTLRSKMRKYGIEPGKG